MGVRIGPAIGLVADVALLTLLARTVGLGPLGWLVGVACGLVTIAMLARGLERARASTFGPANWVTLSRAALVAGVAALVSDGFVRPTSVFALVALSVIALVLDGVDGPVARRTGTATALGARFDMEVDAFLIFALSVSVARSLGPWVLAIGMARYAFVSAGWLLPWLRESAPPRYWCKVVAVIQGVVLSIAAAGILPDPLIRLAVLVALLLLAESFGREISWLWRHRLDHDQSAQERSDVERPTRSRELRAELAWITTTVGFLLAWFVLVAPNRLVQLTPAAFLRIPLEALVMVAVLLILPPRSRTILAAVVGLILGLLAVVKVLDFGFYAALDRPFNPVTDWSYLGPGVGVLRDSIGAPWAIGAVVGAVVLVIAVVALLVLSIPRLARLSAQHRATSARATVALTVVWLLCAALGLRTGGQPIASSGAAGLAYGQIHSVRASIRDEHAFASALRSDDRFRDAAGPGLLSGLRGKDVLVVFVESYGRVAVQDSTFSPQVDAVLRAGTAELQSAGFSSRSAFLTSPTFGGISWLAHSTLQSGLWISSQLRYNELVASNRFTLSDAFRSGGWRTVGDIPSNSQDWPEGASFYHYDKVYDVRNVGYYGPQFGYAQVPDQYTLSAFARLELTRPHRAPVMAEIDLDSSHSPWAPLPRLVDWKALGDGSVYYGIRANGQTASTVWKHASTIKAAYGQSIRYSIGAIISFVRNLHDDNLVMVVLGDHQPATIVSGSGATHDVPITIIAHDAKVMNRIASWRWQAGMLPGPNAPVWPMDAFRNRFLEAYGPSAPAHSSAGRHR